jgi:replicative DNA helicase
MPHNLEAERAFLGSILLDNRAIHPVGGKISADDLFADSHRLIFRHTLSLMDRGICVDSVTLAEELGKSGELEKAGGVAYLAGLSDGVPLGDYSFIANYATIIKNKSILRQIVNCGDSVMSRAFTASDDPTDILADANGMITAIQEQTEVANRGAVSIAQAISEMLPRLDRASEGEMMGLPTGFPSLDAITAGWHPSEYVVVAARPSVGKTAFAMECSLRVALAGGAVNIFSLEMSLEQLLLRMLCRVGRVECQRLKGGALNRDEYRRLMAASSTLARLPIQIDARRGVKSDLLRWRIRSLAQRTRPKLTVVDYLGLVVSKGENLNAQTTATSKQMQAVAGELGEIYGGTRMVLSQLNRQAANSASLDPELHHLRDSGSIEQDADTVIFLHNEEQAVNGQREPFIKRVSIKKQRNGPCDSIRLLFLPSFVGFREIDDEEHRGLSSCAQAIRVLGVPPASGQRDVN